MKRVLALAALVGAAIAVTVSPAAAAPAASHTDCTAVSFDSVGALKASVASGIQKEPALSETTATLPDAAKGKGGAKFRASVPVWIHVISPDGTTANLTQAQIDEQILILNRGFAGYYGGANSRISFYLAGVTRTTSAAWFNAGIGSNAERDMKRTLHRGGWNTLNVYSNTAEAYLGWAYLPGLPESRQYLDGIVVDWESMKGTSTAYAGRYDLGFTLVHEAGHWFGLEHTFFGGCNDKGDFVDDTPAQRYPSSGCPVGNDTCPDKPGLDPIHNFMDYSYDSCYFEFTAGQSARMQDHWLFFRAGK
jgi:hypothetical protein